MEGSCDLKDPFGFGLPQLRELVLEQTLTPDPRGQRCLEFSECQLRARLSP